MEETIINMGGVKFVTRVYTRGQRSFTTNTLVYGDHHKDISEENAQRLLAMDEQTREFVGLMISSFSKELSQVAVWNVQSGLRDLLGLEPIEGRLNDAEEKINRLDSYVNGGY